jgi:MSHA biogenesis protein MshI
MALHGFTLKKNNAKKPGLCGIQITPEGVAIAQVMRVKGNPVLTRYDFLPSTSSPDSFIPVISEYVKANSLEGIRASWILQSSDYTLLPVGNLPVSTQEIPQALKWHVKDRIDFPIIEASIDYFAVPHLNQSSQEDFIYAIVAKKDFLEKTVRLISGTGLEVNIIDVPEFALRNFAGISLGQQNSIGMIEVNPTRTSLVVIQDNLIYLARQIEWNKKEGVEKLTSEIQRSLDYYESELGHSPVQHFYISPSYQTFFPTLKENLAFNMQDLNWDKLKDIRCISAVGAALRLEESHATAN